MTFFCGGWNFSKSVSVGPKFIKEMRVSTYSLVLFAERRCTTSSVNGKSISKRACIFPFKYNGIKYDECTRIDSEKSWCAYEVDASGNAVDGKWGDCDLGCTKLGKI